MRHLHVGPLVLAAVAPLVLFAQPNTQPQAKPEVESQVRSHDAKAAADRPLDLHKSVWIPHPLPSARPYAGCCFIDPAKIPPMTPWGEAKFKLNRPGFGPAAVSSGSNDPIVSCFPPGVPRVYVQFVPFEFIQLDNEILEVFEYDHFVRHIYIDGRTHPKNLQITWMGHSVGHFEGDTLIVDTVGMNDKTWIDRAGHPHSDALHVVERIRRPDRSTLVNDITIDDPKTYATAFTGQMTFELQPDWEIQEYVCADNVDSSLQK